MPGRRSPASTSWRVWAPPRCCTSTSPTRPRRRSSAPPASACRATRSGSPTADGREAADGEEGILWVRGDSSAPCYWNRPDKTAETMREGGWIYTGDRFVRDADGFHFFRGRADDLVKVSRPVGLSAGGGALPRRPPVRSGNAPCLAVPQADGLTTLKAFVVLAGEAQASDATTRALAGLRQGPAAALQVSAPRRVSGRSAQDRHRQDRPPGPAQARDCRRLDPGES